MDIMTGLTFVYVLLPVMLAVFLLFPPVWRSWAVLGVSVVYLFFVERTWLPLMLLSIALDWAAMLVMEKWDDNPKIRKSCLVFSVVKNLGLIMAFGAFVQLGMVSVEPFGLKVLALSSMGCVIEAWSREMPYLKSPVQYALYCCFFPRLPFGPLVKCSEFAPQLESPNPTPMEMLRGLGLYVQGAVKVGVLASSLEALYGNLLAIPAGEITVAGTWVTVFVLALAVYYRFSGYCVMARGIGTMVGIAIPQNFYFPYQAQSVGDFLGRFNMSLWKFLNETVYRGLRGEKSGPLADTLNLLLMGMFCGLWFGMRINYLVWGAYLALFYALEKHAYPHLVAGAPTLFRRVYTLCIVLSSFTIFGADSLGDSAVTITRMLGFGRIPFVNDRLGYLLSTNWLLLVVSVLFATSAVSLLFSFLDKHLPRAGQVLTGVTNAFLLLLLTVLAL